MKIKTPNKAIVIIFIIEGVEPMRIDIGIIENKILINNLSLCSDNCIFKN